MPPLLLALQLYRETEAGGTQALDASPSLLIHCPPVTHFDGGLCSYTILLRERKKSNKRFILVTCCVTLMYTSCESG